MAWTWIIKKWNSNINSLFIVNLLTLWPYLKHNKTYITTRGHLKTNALIDVCLSTKQKHLKSLVTIHHQWGWNLLQSPRATYKKLISIHIALRISNFMNLKWYLIFFSLLSSYNKVIIGWAYRFVWDGIWIRFPYFIPSTRTLFILIHLHQKNFVGRIVS